MGRLIRLSALLLLNTIAKVVSLPSTTNNGRPVLDIFQFEHQSELKKILPGTFNTTGLPCTNIRRRREWRSLTDAEKAGYINAVKCLQRKPVKSPEMPGVKSMYDQFQAVHVAKAESVHVTGQFFPWHRYFLELYEKHLREDCSYKGDIPYWNWTLDVDNGKKFSDSPLFSPSPIIGFGGDGVKNTYKPPNDLTGENRIVSPEFYRGCVEDGAFADLILQVGPGRNVGPHCLSRGIDDMTASQTLNQANVNSVLAEPTYERFRTRAEGQPVTPNPSLHDGGHICVGGEMSNFYSSPGDPLFYLHHAYLDCLWRKWQKADPENRMYQVTGRTTPEDDFRNATLNYPLSAGPFSRDQPVRIGDMMNIMQQPNCYECVDYAP